MAKMHCQHQDKEHAWHHSPGLHGVLDLYSSKFMASLACCHQSAGDLEQEVLEQCGHATKMTGPGWMLPQVQGQPEEAGSLYCDVSNIWAARMYSKDSGASNV